MHESVGPALGAKPIATSTQYCECGLLAEEIMSRLMTLGVVGGIQMWLLNPALITGAIGLVVAGALGREAGMPVRSAWLGYATAAVLVVVAVLPFFDLYPADALLTLLGAGIMVPAWAIWLEAWAPEIWPRTDAATVVEPSAAIG